MRRRGAQLGGTQNAEELHEQVVARDAKDSAVASFTQAADGVFTVDSSDLDFDQTVDAVLGVVHAAVSRPAGANASLRRRNQRGRRETSVSGTCT